MLEKLLILSLCFVAIRALGEFSVLSSPKSLSFKGNDILKSHDVGEVLNAAMGNPVTSDAQWTGLTINDPFNLPKGIVAVFVDGTNHVGVSANAKSYDIEGSSSYESINAVCAELEANSIQVCDVNLNDFDQSVKAFRACFGDVSIPNVETTALNPVVDKRFIQALGYINAAAASLANMQKPSNFLVIRVSVESVAKAHGGEKSEAFIEAQKLLANAIAELNVAAQKASNNEALVVLIANGASGGRVKRDLVEPNSAKSLNLAPYYEEDYPVIFNIILWFMVAFAFSLLAICYAIGSMDPGRDSIIYRMTSTRMKKDN